MDKAGQFVVQCHARQDESVHWDLMLEEGDILRTYRVNIPPEEWGDDPIGATRIFDHPVKFLSYQGSVNKGKGEVRIADEGTYRIVKEGAGQMKVELKGNVLKGEFLFRI